MVVNASEAAWQLRRATAAALMLALAAVGSPAHAAEQAPARKPAPAKTTGSAAKPAAAPAPAPAPPAAPQDSFGDGIAAVVNKDVITLRELRDATQRATKELSSQGIQVPPSDVLQRQVLQRLITERLEQQEAKRLNIRVDDAVVNEAIKTIADRNKISLDQMKVEVQKTGVTWADYQRNIRNEILTDRLRQRIIDPGIIITDSEIDNFLKEQQRRPNAAQAAAGPAPQQAPVAPAAQDAAVPQEMPSGPVQIALAQILVHVPESATPDQVAVLRKKAEDILARLRKGENFASIAAAVSDGPEALQGGIMGARPLDAWPDLFVKAVANLPKGAVSGIVQSGQGFHILKVVDRAGGGASAPASTASRQGPAQQQPNRQQPAQPGPGGPGGAANGMPPMPQGPVEVTQTHVRHILIKTSSVMTDAEAHQRLDVLRQRIVNGEKFEDLARQNSQDGSAPQGGDLGWLNPGETVPQFEAAMNALADGQLSQPIQTQFGWHLIQVLGRRQKDVSADIQRMQARRILFERRADPAFDDWLAQIRDMAYIDNRIEKQARKAADDSSN
jgi:peptidyl-prolyl cis-trans isomerase SurA